MIKVLICDDDKNICEILRLYLNKYGFETVIAYDGDGALDLFKKYEPNIVLLDVMMPVRDGWNVLREIRKTSDCPVIMITAKNEVFDKVLGLELGADDYIVKPFDSKEVVARIKAVLRRSSPKEGTSSKIISYENLVINMANYELLICGERVDMPKKELEVLYHLASNPNRVFTRDQLLDEVWGFEYFGDSRTVDVHIKRIRSKLGNPSHKWYLNTVWGVGYKFEVYSLSEVYS
ncbi:MAG: response regulator transcription factor [Clostridia bacterium]